MENSFPDKFKNQDGTLNTESLVQSYAELEKKLGSMVNIPTNDSDEDTREKFNRAIGVPENPSEYTDHPMFSDIPDLKERFHSIGLTKSQAESVYKIAAEFLTPMLGDVMNAANESENMAKLEQLFGRDENTISALREIDAYAQKKLSPAAYEELASSADGIETIYKMMQSDEPDIKTGAATKEAPSENDLRNMMRDPKYWRDHDQEFVRKIEIGFKKLFK